MSSEVVPDILNGLVAAGTLALAGATVFVGRAAVRASIDGRCPRTVVAQLQVEDEPRNWPVAAKAEPGEIKPRTLVEVAQHGADRMGIKAVALLRNERTVTALFRIEHDSDCEVSTVVCRDPDPISGLAVTQPAPQQEGWYVIAPGGGADINFIWWRSSSAWADAWRRGAEYPELSPPTTTARLTVRGASGDAVDRCDLTFGGYVLVPYPREDGWVIAIVDRPWRKIPGTAPERVARIGLCWSYPGFFDMLPETVASRPAHWRYGTRLGCPHRDIGEPAVRTAAEYSNLCRRTRLSPPAHKQRELNERQRSWTMPTVCIQTVCPRWPLFGRTRTLNAAAYCAPVSIVWAGHQWIGQVTGTCDTINGSDARVGPAAVPAACPMGRLPVALHGDSR